MALRAARATTVTTAAVITADTWRPPPTAQFNAMPSPIMMAPDAVSVQSHLSQRSGGAVRALSASIMREDYRNARETASLWVRDATPARARDTHFWDITSHKMVEVRTLPTF